MGQSTNDTFPTAIHVAAAVAIRDKLVPVLAQCGEVLARKAEAWQEVLKIGRTHLADATPLSRAFDQLGAPFCVLDIADAAPRDIYGHDLILLRPDLHVAWRGNEAPDNPDELAAVVTGHGVA